MTRSWILVASLSLLVGAQNCATTSTDRSEDGGAGGATCDDGTAKFCVSGSGAVAGSIAYQKCADWRRAGLAEAQCPEGAEANVSTLLSWCEHYDAQLLDGTNMSRTLTRCIGTIKDYDLERQVQELDLALICSPSLSEKIRSCSDAETPCERPPLCIKGGTFTCDDIRKSCPAITAEQCRSGFDSARHAGRVAIHECLTTAPEGEDCVATFYRCVWGL